jgi:hypothetical protein
MVEEYRYAALRERRAKAKLHGTNPTIGPSSSSDQQPRGLAEQRLEPSPPTEEMDELLTIQPIQTTAQDRKAREHKAKGGSLP